MNEMVNLLVDLDGRFDAAAEAAAKRSIEALGYATGADAEEAASIPAWIDEVFGGTWSTEAFAGTTALARAEEGGFAGFASYAPKGLRFSWLRGIGAEAGVGIFGPFGVAPSHRKSGIGPHLLTLALAGLHRLRYDRALIPAVGEEKLVDYYARHAGARVVETFEKRSFVAKRFRTVVMASGNGSNFQAVLDASQEGRLPLDIATLVCNDDGAFALQRARDAGIEAAVVAWDRAAESRAAYDARLLDAMRALQPDLVLLLGWMHLLDGAFVEAFSGKTINLHPAYLPLDQRRDRVRFPDGEESAAFRGAHAIRDAIAARASWFGATAHEVDGEADRGRILVRKPVQLPADADIETATTRLRPVEQKVVAGAIMRWIYER